VDQKLISSKNLQFPVTTLLFDMDNTLFDLVGAQIAACQAVVEQLGYDDGGELFSYFLSPSHGFESHENIRQYMNDRNIPVDGLYRKACCIYETEKLRNITPYPGVLKTLNLLYEDGYIMGIVTDAHSRDACRRLEKTGLLTFFSHIVSFDMIGQKKPAPEPFLLALEMLQAGNHETLLIGDSPRRDLEPGRLLGIRTVYARYGDRFSDGRFLVQADFTIDSISDLPAVLGQLPKTQQI
jgi:putative hydrolase of the HAD superfamily